jgi:hypothetical protein
VDDCTEQSDSVSCGIHVMNFAKEIFAAYPLPVFDWPDVRSDEDLRFDLCKSMLNTTAGQRFLNAFGDDRATFISQIKATDEVADQVEDILPPVATRLDTCEGLRVEFELACARGFKLQNLNKFKFLSGNWSEPQNHVPHLS